VDVFFRQYWQDPRLKHTLEEPIVLTGSHRNVIWLPDTFFLNIKTANYHNVPADNSRVTIEQDGQITWSSRYWLMQVNYLIRSNLSIQHCALLLNSTL